MKILHLFNKFIEIIHSIYVGSFFLLILYLTYYIKEDSFFASPYWMKSGLFYIFIIVTVYFLGDNIKKHLKY